MPDDIMTGVTFFVRFMEMREICINRSTCIECPYFPLKVCERMTTDEALNHAVIYLRPFVKRED